MRVIFINRYFYPDHSATSQLLTELAFDLVTTGREVHVIASRQQYDEPRATLEKSEQVAGVQIHRLWTTRFGRSGLFGRSLDYLTFYMSAAIHLGRMLRRGDIVVAKTDPPLMSILTAVVTRGRRVARVNWLQDIYPEVAERLGIRVLAGPAGGILARLRDWSLRAAVANIALGSRMAELLSGRGVPPALVRIIPNWIDDQSISPIPREANDLRRDWGLTGKFVVGYSGNLGRAHEYQTLVEAARAFRERDDIVFLFIGGGHQYAGLRAELKLRGVEHLALFKPWQDQSRLAQSLGVPDVHWVSLRPEMEGLIVPSKFYGIAAAGRPTLAITEKDGEIARLVTRHECGAVAEPGDSARLAALIGDLARDPAVSARWGANAREMLDKEFSREHALRQWRELVAETDAGAKRRRARGASSG